MQHLGYYGDRTFDSNSKKVDIKHYSIQPTICKMKKAMLMKR